MFIFTAKLTRKKLAVGIGAAGALLIGLIVLMSSGGGAEASAATSPSPKGVKTAEDRVAYLTAHGWAANAESEECQEVVIPKAFDSAFEEYNALQKGQGFDLSKHKGRRIKRYIYLIENHPSGRSPVYASLLIHKNTVIGGDLQNPALDGFIQGFERNGRLSP
ncbi:MAG: DUF4830 domain-containing protein [Oscillospiraceae bacterium]|nr:DUF4830 domain-containing protein [Oscillospiraceae bacterium]